MLQHRQLVLAVLDIVEQPEEQARGDGGAADADRAFDRFLDLVPAHPRDEEFPVVDSLGQPQELRAFPQKIRAHGQHDINILVRLLRGVQQQVHEADGFLLARGAGPVKAEQFLELIDHEQQFGAGGSSGLAHGLKQTVAAAAERGLQVEQGVFGIRVVEPGFAQGAGQVSHRAAAGAHNGDFPGAAGLGHAAAQHRREQPGTHQRRLAAARGAHHSDQAVGAQAAQQVFDLLVPAEEQVVFVRQKAAQARKRIAEIEHGGS